MPPPRIRSEKEKYDKLLQGKKDSNYNTIQKEFLTLKNLYMNMDTNRFDTTLQAGYLLGDVYDFFLKKIYESYLLQKNEEEILKDKDITNELITCLVERKPIDNKRVLWLQVNKKPLKELINQGALSIKKISPLLIEKLEEYRAKEGIQIVKKSESH